MNRRHLISLALLCSPLLLAHDMWIEPSTFFPKNGDIVSLRLLVGQELLGDPLPRSSALINRFIHEDAAGRKPVIGREGANPAGFVRVAEPGMQVVGYWSNPSAVEQTAEKFNRYLKEEGLDSIAALRARRGQKGDVVHELFARCAKSLVLSGAPNKLQADRALGLPLELVAERNPYLLGAAEELPVRLTYENRPLAGALVVAINRLNPMEKLSARSGVDGRVRLKLRSGGMWLIKTVHMIPAPAGANAEWLSYWASLTFELPVTNAKGR